MKYNEATTWFTSDTHFGHANIIKYSKRPFSDVSEMDEALIRNWNDVVGQDDNVFHLGDFAFRNEEAAARYRSRLNGNIHLIWGNHDSSQVRNSGIWASSNPYLEINVGQTMIVLLHYGMRVWNKSSHGSLHFFGHSHASLPGDNASVDVGVDYPAWNYSPARLSVIQRHLRTLPSRNPVDHHGVSDNPDSDAEVITKPHR